MESLKPNENQNEKEASLSEELQELADMPSFKEFRKTVEQEKTTPISDVYAEIAQNALMKWNGLSQEDAAQKVANESFDELESQIGAKNSITTAFESIAARLGVDRKKMEDAVFNGGDEGVFEEAKKKVEENFNTDFIDDGIESCNNKEQLVLDVLADIHDKWCADNETKFFNEKRENKRYQFLDFSLIGFDEATADLLFAESIFKKIGIEIDLDNLDEQYTRYPNGVGSDADTLSDDYDNVGDDENWLGYGCIFAENLYDSPEIYLSKGASQKIKEAIQKDFNIAAEMTMQVGEHNPLEEADWGCLWAYHKGGEEGVADYILGDYDPLDEDENDSYFTSNEYINDGWE